MILPFLTSNFGGLGGGFLLAEGSALEEPESAAVGEAASVAIFVASGSALAVASGSLSPFVEAAGSLKRRVDGKGRLAEETVNLCGAVIVEVGVREVRIVF